MSPSLRVAGPADAAALLAIYAPLVRETAVSFEIDPPAPADLAARVAEVLARYPWLVAEEAGSVVGYAYASRHRERAAYRWSVDVSVYVRADRHRRGVARRLYAPLLEMLRLQGFVTAHAGIALPNPGSVALHEGFGFRPVGIYRSVGYKLGRWHDVGWWALPLLPPPAPPAEPLPFEAFRRTPACSALLAGGEGHP